MSESDTRNERHESTIVPVRRPAAADAAALAPVPRRRLRPPVLGIAIVLLAAGLIVVFGYLPERVEEQREVEAPVVEVVEEAAMPAERPLTRAEYEALREEAGELLAQLLEQRSELEDRSVASWGEADWGAYETAARLADDAFLADDLREAIEQYETALDIGELLFGRAQEIMTGALAAGEEAIAAGNPELALNQFELVLSVDPDHRAALTGRERALALPDVLAAMRRGDEARLAGDLSAAADAYREALAIDRNWQTAREALDEVTAVLAESRFERLIADGFVALDDGRFDTAIELFNAAVAMRPDSEAARDGLAQAGERQLLNSIVMAEVRAKAFERRELWDQAIERYREALEIDPTLSFALEGVERAQARADLKAKLDALIGSPRLLLSEDMLRDARSVLADAMAIDEPGPEHTELTTRLAALIELASTPLNVTLISDNATEVTVYRIGDLGTFSSLELSLKPGEYIAIGARRGYRDVRETFTVLPGRDNGPVTVICVEPI